jgi:hypothetical protein
MASGFCDIARYRSDAIYVIAIDATAGEQE